VYDVTNFVNEHPGGKKIVLREGGKDASKKFKMFHSNAVLPAFGPDLLIGEIGDEAAAAKAEQKQKQEAFIQMM
jgi:cytochrome b involved in lipid metabolism